VLKISRLKQYCLQDGHFRKNCRDDEKKLATMSAFCENDWFFPSETTATEVTLNCIYVIGTVYQKYNDFAGRSSQHFFMEEI
jgi:hypothetical protein